ncbi:hypothetical protein DFP72DRAFT_843881 [Ephemerocybe angulata]|uniref:F-box domain-containing protein n=1 Tax=Ephemerocybe angulata TaxID=980116 RepID=A0A8H6M9A9_9AGAR|nr:hypothetical protein DFP72DRAFT_843881 [Tulosesus angulatus]
MFMNSWEESQESHSSSFAPQPQPSVALRVPATEEGTKRSTYSLATKALLDGIGDATNPRYAEQLKQRVRALEREIIALKNGQNMFSSINHLPPEILGMIFELCINSVRKSITTICRHWREVAINHSPLWSRLSFCAPNYAAMMLTRSKGAPLYVEYNDMRDGHFTKVLCRALDHPHRLWVLSLSRSDEKKTRRLKAPPLVPNSILGAALSKLSEPLPLLVTLKIVGITRPRDRSGLIDWVPTGLDDREKLPVDFLTGGASKLRRLTLEGCLFRWSNVPPSSRLTHLRLSVSPAAEYERPAADDFFRSLTQMPLLEDMYLAALHTGASPVDLSNIAYLHLDDSVAAVISFFGGVRVQKRSNIKLDCGDVPNDEEMGQLLGNMTQSWRDGPGLAVRSLRIDEDHFRIELLREREERSDDTRDAGWGTQGRVYDSYADDTPSGTCSRLWSINIFVGLDGEETDGNQIDAFTQSLSTHFDLAHLKSLQVESHRGYSRSLFQSTFGHLPSLTTITFVRGSPRTHVFGLLPIHATDEQPESIPPARPAILFPVLNSLLLETLGFGKGTHCEVGVLIQMLQQRLEVGPLLELEINACCHIGAKDVARIKAALPGVTVEWDFIHESDSEYL